MQYSLIERKFALYLRRFPKIKQLIKRSISVAYYFIFQTLGSRRICDTDFDVRLVTTLSGSIFFGYYDSNPENCDGVVLCHRTSEETDQRICEILTIEPESNEGIVLATSRAFNLQQGARLTWLDHDRFCFNDLDIAEDNYVTRIWSYKTKTEVATIGYAQQACFQDKYFVTTDFKRAFEVQPEYGYQGHKAREREDFSQLQTEALGLIDLKTYTKKTLYTFEDIVNACKSKESISKDSRHYVNHVMFDPSGRHFIFVHRIFVGGRRTDRLLMGTPEGFALRAITNADVVSHYCFLEPGRILAFMNDEKTARARYQVIDLISGEHRDLSLPQLNGYGDGHPSMVSRDSFITDTYADKAGEQKLMLANETTGALNVLATVRHPINFVGPIRCDLHPRFSSHSKRVYFDSVMSGTRKLYSVDLKDVV